MADPKIKVYDKEYPLVMPWDFDLGEAADAERITGQDYDWDKPIGGLGLLALTFISVRRIDALAKLDDIRILNGADFDVQMPEGDAVPPAPSADSSGSETSSSQSGEATSAADSQEPTPEISGVPV